MFQGRLPQTAANVTLQLYTHALDMFLFVT